MPFQLPPRLHTADGRVRRVGIELEFSGIDLESVAEITARVTGGHFRRTGKYTCRVMSDYGDFQIEFDSGFFKNKRFGKYLAALGLNPDDSALGQSVEELASRVGELIIPFEVVTPPLPMTRMSIVEQIREELRKHHAKGTLSAPFRAFGLQFNPEVPDFRAHTLLCYIRAFFVLFDWLYEESDIPISRRLTPYIHSFPQEYVDLVLDPSYEPELGQLMRDYLQHNPTRNRPLDLLPLFSYIDKGLVFSYPIEADLVKSRPTFHYRLPNSEIDDPSWTIAGEWNRWAGVERLSADPVNLARLCEDYVNARRSHTFERGEWVKRTKELVHA
jgi:hypothetical protein